MKFAQAFLCAAVCGFVLSFHATARADLKPGYVTIVRIDGEARYSKGNNEWYPLTVGQTLTEGSIIQTAAHSTVDVVLGEKLPVHIDPHAAPVASPSDSAVSGLTSLPAETKENTLRLDGNTVLAVDKLTISDTGVDAVSDTELDLRQGTIFGNVKKLSASSQYFVKVPNGIAGVRGTTFILSANGAITVVKGSMVLSFTGPNGPVTVVLGPGDQYNPFTGQTTHLTPQQLKAAERSAIITVTLIHGIITFATDCTTIYISPTHGRPPHVPPIGHGP